MDLPLVAVCIPTYNLGKESLILLNDCLNSIEIQDYPHIIVVVSDHSEDDDIWGYLTEGRPNKLDVVYEKFEEGRGHTGVPNMNNSFDIAPKDAIIKPMNQDDFLRTPDAISRMVTAMRNSGSRWAACGCDHIDDDRQNLNYNHPPRWVPDFMMAYGLNHIGSLSVIMLEQTDLRQDVELRWLNDCEFYYRLGKEYGPPALVDDLLVTIRMRKNSLSSQLASDLDEIKRQEQRYVQKKHGVTS